MSKKPKTKAKLSIQEFQTWLQGIMEFQDDNWSPNIEQWNAIYDKIMNLKVDTPTANISAASLREIAEVIEDSMPNFNQPSAYQHQQPSQPLVEGNDFIQQPEQYQPPVQLSEEELQQKIEKAKSGTAITPIKTKDIDTSDGSYKSDFI